MRIAEPTLEVRDLRLALALASTGTTARAAELLHLTQPSVSRALLSLEDRLGTRLFERTARGLVPTAAGERLVARAGDLLGELGALERRVRDPVPATRIRLVCECHTAYHWLPSTLAALREQLPELSLSLRIEHTNDAPEALAAGTIDAALLTTARKSDGTIEIRPLFSDELVFLVASDHPLARKQALTPSDLKSHPLFSPGPTPGESAWFMASVFGRARPRLDVTRVPLTEAIVDLARAKLGIGILTEWVVTPHLARGGIAIKRLSKGPLRRQWQLGWRRELGDAGPRLLAALEAYPPNGELDGRGRPRVPATRRARA